MASTIVTEQRLNERMRRLEADNQQLRELVIALQHEVEALHHIIDDRQRQFEPREPPRVLAPPVPPSGGLVSAYNESLRTPQEVRAFIQARGLFGLGRGDGRQSLRYIEGDPQHCDFWGVRDAQRGDVLVLPGRKHYMNSSALARDDGHVGREALGPVFEITWGSVFSLVQAARGRETAAGIEILQLGRLEVPR